MVESACEMPVSFEKAKQKAKQYRARTTLHGVTLQPRFPQIPPVSVQIRHSAIPRRGLEPPT